MSYEPDWNEPSFYTDEDEACEVCTESPCLCERYRIQDERERGQGVNTQLLIEALWIAKDNFDYDGEHEKAEQIGEYIKELGGKRKKERVKQ